MHSHRRNSRKVFASHFNFDLLYSSVVQYSPIDEEKLLNSKFGDGEFISFFLIFQTVNDLSITLLIVKHKVRITQPRTSFFFSLAARAGRKASLFFAQKAYYINDCQLLILMIFLKKSFRYRLTIGNITIL
jgi:hypothetical protein